MFLRRLVQLASASLLMAGFGRAEENVWPLFVTRSDEVGTTVSAQYVGPLFFHKADPAKDVRGFRPLFLTTQTGDLVERNILYPLFTWKYQPGHSSFTFLHIVEGRSSAGKAETPDGTFDIWPIYLSRHTADPARSYQAIFPLAGTTLNRLGRDRITFVAWPLYLQTQKGGRQVTHMPWPIIRAYDGPGYDGFEVWPLFGRNTHAGDYDHQFYLWPIVHYSVDHLGRPVPDKRVAVLPFYARATGPGYKSETFLWPFFGYTDRTAPDVYHERRYLWPFLVQGHGNQRTVNRWAPIYTHSVSSKSVDKTWYFWPLYRHMSWQDGGVQQDKNQILYCLYWSLEQRSLQNPAAAPARKAHVWPLITTWDNGAGRRQVQALSPFEVLFPYNTKIRQLWTPLFALYQYDAHPDGTVRHAYLWNAITWRHSPGGREFHFGPVFDVRQDAEQKRVALICGLFGWRRTATTGWKPFLFDFHPKAANKAGSGTTP